MSLTPRDVDKAETRGLYGDGDGLYLAVAKGGSKSWIYRYQMDGRRRDLGLGGYPAVTLAQARIRRDEARKLVRLEGIDPLAVRHRQKAAVAAQSEIAAAAWSNNELIANNASGTGLVNAVGSIVKGGLAGGGIVTASALFSVTMTAVLQSLPMVQAIMLLGIYALLPLVVVLSRYSIAMMVVGGMAIFTIKFWTVLWYLAMWVDQNLIMSMYPDVNVFLQIFANPGEHDAKRMLLNMITTSLYLGLPLLWSGMMAWAGVHIGRSVTAATSPLARPADDAGRQGGSLGKMAVSKGMKK